MMIFLLLLLLLVTPAYAAPGIAVVQSAAPTSNGGTQDFTSSGFGTPVCAMFFGSYGTANGTVVDHAGLWIGFSDFTNERTIAHVAEDAQADTDTAGIVDTSSALITLLNTDQSTDGTADATTITDGVRLTWADAPPAAYLITAVLFNSSAISGCAVGSIANSATENNAVSVTGLAFQPDLILAFSQNNITGARTSFGMGLNDGSIVQRAGGQNSQSASATTDVSSALFTTRLTINPLSATPSSPELTAFTSDGFTLTTRDGSSANTTLYMAMKLATGISAKLLTCASPTATGAHSCTGAGFTPQAGIMLHTSAPAVDTFYSTGGNPEIYGLSAFTGSAAYSATIFDDDGVATSDTESITDSKPVRIRKDTADWMTATSTGAQADGWNFDYTVTDGTARQRAVLFFKADQTTVRRRPVFFP